MFAEMNDALIQRCRRYRNTQRRPGERPDIDGMETALRKILEHTMETMTWIAWMENLIKVQLSKTWMLYLIVQLSKKHSTSLKKHSTRSHNELERTHSSEGSYAP